MRYGQPTETGREPLGGNHACNRQRLANNIKTQTRAEKQHISVPKKPRQEPIREGAKNPTEAEVNQRMKGLEISTLYWLGGLSTTELPPQKL